MTFMLGAIAYIAMAFAAIALFSATGTTGSRRGPRFLILGVLITGAGLQVVMLLAPALGLAPAMAGLQILAASCLLAVPVSFWPLVERVRRGQLHVVNRRLMARVERAERDAAAARNWLNLAEEAGHVGHWQFFVDGNRMVWSDEVFRIHGLWREHYKPRLDTALAALHPADGKRVGELLQDAITRGAKFEVAARLRRPDGELRHVILRGGPQLGEGDILDSVAGVLVDVTEPTRAVTRMLPGGAARDLPLEDNLTGLADRQQFDLSLGYEFKRAVRSRKPLGLVVLDIDRFRAFNDHYGALEGDACLRQIAQAVQAVPRRTGDVVARYSGAEIAVLLPLAGAAGALRVAATILEAVRALGLPNITDPTGAVTVSCGAAAFIGMDDLYNPLELTRRAARALGDAKAAGGNRVCSFNAPVFLETLGAR
jgi:diguanylate cyclase (GGDEF)-like protein